MKKLIIAVVAVLVLGGSVAAIVAQTQKVKVVQTDPAATVPPEASGDEPKAIQNPPRLIIGDPKAKLTILDYGDFQCPICKRFFEQTEPQLIKEYIDTGKVNIEFKVESHLGAESRLAGEAAYCANDQGQFRHYHDELFKRQKGINSGAFSAANLKKIAGDLNFKDELAFGQCLDTGKYRQIVIDSHNQAQAKINGTPTFYIGSQKIVGAQPFSVFKAVIDSQLK